MQLQWSVFIHRDNVHAHADDAMQSILRADVETFRISTDAPCMRGYALPVFMSDCVARSF